jgi:serine/threonine protein phosphatase PrpC
MVPEGKLKEVLTVRQTAEAACRTLVNIANDNGGRDNITVVIAQFQPPEFGDIRERIETVTAPVEATKTTVAFEPIGVE